MQLFGDQGIPFQVLHQPKNTKEAMKWVVQLHQGPQLEGNLLLRLVSSLQGEQFLLHVLFGPDSQAKRKALCKCEDPVLEESDIDVGSPNACTEQLTKN